MKDFFKPTDLIYPSNFESKIGFSEIREQVKAFCQLADSRELVDDISFTSNFKQLIFELNATAEFKSSLEQLKEPLRIPFTDVPETNIGMVVKKLELENSYLQPSEFLNILKILRCANALIHFFNSEENDQAANLYPYLRNVVSKLFPSEDTIRDIERVLDKAGEIKQGASQELDEVRSKLRSVLGSVNSVMGRVLKSAIANGILEADVTPVIREGRLVLPVNAMNKRALSGIVHGESATGRTVFIEPAEVVENNNRIKELELQEQRLIIEILTQLTGVLRDSLDVVRTNTMLITRLDFLRAKAIYAISTGGQLPHLSKKPELEWFHAIHPLLLKHLKSINREIVPLDIVLTEQNRILLISGPNAGGKSVALKTVGMVQYMMQCGLLPTLYSNSHMGIFRNLFIDIGDEQSMNNDLSTYSSHMRNMKSIVAACDKNSLVLIDEFGAGTEPLIGGAIAEAILLKINDEKTWGVITTHYQNLKQAAENTKGLINGSMLYDRHLMQPLFSLSIGSPGSSFALEIARKTGLPESILQRATEIVGQEYVDTDKYLLDINRDRKYWEQKRYDIKVKERKLDQLIEKWEETAEELRKHRRSLIDEAKKKADDIIKGANKSIENTIRGIKEHNADKEKTKELRTELESFRKKIEAEYLEEKKLLNHQRQPKKKNNKPTEQSGKPSSMSIGDFVKLDGKGDAGEIIDITGKKAIVSFGIAKITVELDRLEVAKSIKKQVVKVNTMLTKTAGDQQSSRRQQFRQEIDVRGMRVDEALQAVTYLIDDAIQYSTQRVRILHGTGTGALRQAIRDYLRTLGSGINFRDEDVRLGGAGITVVDIP